MSIEKIVAKVLDKKLSFYVKNWTSSKLENWELKDLELNEKVLQQLLHIPPCLILKEIKVNSLKVKVPWKKLKHEPVVFKVDRVEIILEEPVDLQPISQPEKKKEKKSQAVKRVLRIKLLMD